MEEVFYNKNSTLKMNILLGMINYNSKLFPITKIHLNTPQKGKIETQDLILKWFDETLFIYDKIGSIELLETLKKEKETFKINKINENNKENIIKFYLTKNIYIYFYDNEIKYVTNLNEEKEIVIKIYKTGSFFVYETLNKNKLYINPLKNIFKYNGLAISKVN